MHEHVLLYLDPGTGSLFFQFIISAFLTGLIFVKKIGLYVRYFFSRIKGIWGNKSEE